jgi:hypothetical protein
LAVVVVFDIFPICVSENSGPEVMVGHVLTGESEAPPVSVDIVLIHMEV